MRLSLVFALIPFYLFAFPSCRAAAETDFRFRMLVSAKIDGYPNDDDVSAIARYLTVAGDQKLVVPDDIADWIAGRIGHLGPSATPRMISAYMHFLRATAAAPPFDSGLPVSARYRLLSAMAKDLRARGTPLAELALLMFEEANDSSLRQLATSADFIALKSFPWLVGFDDWMQWIFNGLSPDSVSSANLMSPDFPVVSDKAKAGILKTVQAFISQMDLHSPVIASSANFLNFTHSSGYSWTRIKYGSAAPYFDSGQLLTQSVALADTLSDRIAATLGVPPLDHQSIDASAQLYNSFGASFSVDQLKEQYRKSLGITPIITPQAYRR